VKVGDLVRYFVDMGDHGSHGVVVADPWVEQSTEFEDETTIMTEVLFATHVETLCVDTLEAISEGG